MATTTTSVLPPAIAASYALKMLLVKVPNMIHNICAVPKMMPRNGGTTYRMSRFNPLDPSLVPLGNSGDAIPAQVLTRVDIDAKISFYGGYVILNEQTVLQNESPVLNVAAERLGVAMRQTEDMLTRNMLESTASAIYCVGGSNGDSPTELTAPDVSVVVAALLGNDAFSIMDNIEGSNKFGTSPTRRAFFAMCHTNLTASMENVNGFTSIANYPSPQNILDSEWGAIQNIRFLISSIGSVTKNASRLGRDIYNILVTGMEGYCNVKQDGYSNTFVYRPPVFSDALAQNATVAYKFACCPRITNELWVTKLCATLAV